MKLGPLLSGRVSYYVNQSPCCSPASFPNLSLEFIISLDDLIASNQLSLTLSHLSFLVLGVHNFGHTKKMAKYIQTSIVTRFFRRKVSLTRTCLLLFGKPMKYIQSASPFSFQFQIQLVYRATVSLNTLRIQISNYEYDFSHFNVEQLFY